MNGIPIVRPVRTDDAEGIWSLLKDAAADIVGMGSLPRSAEETEEICADTSATVADLATGAFQLDDGTPRRLLLAGFDSSDGKPFGVTGLTFKSAIPNLVIRVSTSQDGQGLIMRSTSEPWTRTELDSSFIGPHARGQRFGTLLSRGRLMFLHLVQRKVPNTIASHLRGRFDNDASAPFWRCFGSHFAPQWATSSAAETALNDDITLLDSLAGHILPLAPVVLESLGRVNEASMPAFRMLMAEGLRPNGMYDPIDGGPTLVSDLADTATKVHRCHGRAVVGSPGSTDALVSVAAIDRFRVTRALVDPTDSSEIRLGPDVAAALEATSGTLLAISPLKTPEVPMPNESGEG